MHSCCFIIESTYNRIITKLISSILLQTPTPQVPVNSTSLQTLQNRKPHRNLNTTGRPRGRPPNVNKYLQHALQQSGNVMSQFSSKSNFANYMSASGPNRSMINPYFMNPLVDTNMLSAILASGLSSNMMDPLAAMTYLNQVGSYQDILRQYQNNLSSLTNLGLNNPGTTITSISNVSTMSTSSSNIITSSNITNLNSLKGSLDPMTASVQQLLSLSNSTASTSRTTPMYHQTVAKTNTTMSITKDRPNISITPVSTSISQQPHHKVTKQPSKQPSSQTEPVLPVHIPKSLQISPTKPVLHSSNTTAQVSLLKPSIIQQVKSSPPKQMSAPQIRVSKSLTEPQPAHNPSLSHSPLKNSGSTVTTNPVGAIPHVAHTSMGAPVIMKQQQALSMTLPNVSRSGTSLQHKLLSKKNSQRPYSVQTNVQNHSVRKVKSTVKTAAMPVSMAGNFPNLLNTIPQASSAAMTQPPFMPPELSGISVNPVGSQHSSIKAAIATAKYHNYKKSISKPKPSVTSAMEVPSSLPASFSSGSSVEALSMLSQLQQHSHLEIIPQQKAPLKPSIDYSKTLSSSVSAVPPKVPETLRPSTADCMSMYDISRGKVANVSNKKTQDKLLVDNVEIITLDD